MTEQNGKQPGPVRDPIRGGGTTGINTNTRDQGPQGTTRVSGADGPDQGPQGTARVPPGGGPTLGPQGTTRVSAGDPPQGPQGTTRVSGGGPTQGPRGTTHVSPDGPTLGPQGTTRVSPGAGPAQGPQGTTRVSSDSLAQSHQGTTRVNPGQPQAGVGAVHGTTSTTSRYVPGQTIQLNGVMYRIDAELTATSSEAVTYRAERGPTTFVLKQYHRGIAMPRDVLGKVKSCPHRNIVRIEDFGSLDGQDAEILELLPAGNLDQYLRRRGAVRDLATLRRLARGILDGLHHLHSVAGVIYQDLKPENILLGDENLDRVVLADFGISSLVKPGQGEATVKANGTKEYAAPELARFGNQTDASVDSKVDYFAFGVTLLECWLGRRPFEGVPDAARLRQVRDMDLSFPHDIDPQLKLLITGLLKPLPKERSGREEIIRWLEGKTLGASDSTQRRQYSRSWFNDQESFSTPAELAALLERYPAKGMDYLYLGRIGQWLDAAGDMDLSTEVLKITRNFDKDDKLRRAGLLRAIYSLDPSRPFITAGGKVCRTGEDVGDAFWDEKAHYVQALKDPTDPFHLYLQATGEGNTSAEILKLHLSSNSADLAFNTTVFALQGGGRDRLKLGDQFYFSCEDVNADPRGQAALRAELKIPHSRGLIWLRKLGVIEKTKALDNAEAADAMALLKAFPWLNLHSDAPGLLQRQAQIANTLVDANRLDLLDTYRDKWPGFDCGDEKNPPPLHHAVRTGNESAVRYLLDHGASVGFKDQTGSTALLIAVEYRKTAVAKLLIERGSDVNAEDNRHMTPLGAACSLLNLGHLTYQVSPELVDLLIHNGAQADQPFVDGQLPLHRAFIDCDSAASAQAILESIAQGGGSVTRQGADTMFQNYNGYDALFCCLLAYKHIRRQNSAFLPLLTRIVQLGGNIQGFHEGKTPLHYAALWADEPLARTLLGAGADPAVAASDGLLPAAVARIHNSTYLTSLLQPGAGFMARARLQIGLEYIVKAGALAILAVCISPVVPIFLAPQTNDVVSLIALYVVLQLAVAGGALVVFGSDTAFASWLTTVFKSGAKALMALVGLPALAALISMITSLMLGTDPGTYVIGHTYTEAWVALAVSMVLAGATVFGSLKMSERTEDTRNLLLGIGVGTASGARVPGLPPRMRLIAVALITGVAVATFVMLSARNGAHGIFYAPQPDDYTPLTKTTEGTQHLEELGRALNGKVIYNIPTATFVRVSGQGGSCDIEAHTKITAVTFKMSGSVITAEGRVPQDVCREGSSKQYGTHNWFFEHTLVRFPLWALPLDRIYSDYVANGKAAKLPNATDWTTSNTAAFGASLEEAAAPETARRAALFPELHHALQPQIRANPRNLFIPVESGFDVRVKRPVRTAEGCSLAAGSTFPLKKIRLLGVPENWQPGSIDVALPSGFCAGHPIGRINGDYGMRDQLENLEIIPQPGVTLPSATTTDDPTTATVGSSYPETPGLHELPPLPDSPRGLHVFRHRDMVDPAKQKYFTDFPGLPAHTAEVMRTGNSACPSIPIGSDVLVKGFLLEKSDLYIDRKTNTQEVRNTYRTVVSFPASVCSNFFKGQVLYIPESGTEIKHDTPVNPTQQPTALQ